ncbi:MAG: phospholipid carrier-dependent glycosyltransferase [Gammaproteobacteria bacterium]|nr:phospholipid carrier-dependent glycosyltransferase [Gammaproteobacteria bacterium]
MTLPRPSILALFLFLLAVAVLLPGITDVTGVTGKDEYLLSLRTPMHMIEGGHGWLPWLDGEPRLKKPPLIYWLGKISYETLGVSLFSGRIIGVLFTALFSVVVGLLAWSLFKNKRVMLFSGLIILGSLGVMIDGRRLMLDIPVAALSGLAILFLVYWRAHGRAADIIISGAVLGLAFLLKGPVAFFFYFAAFAALIIATPGSSSFIRRSWLAGLAGVLVFLLVAVPWFAYLALQYPELLSKIFASEVAERELFNFSFSPLLSLFIMALPWSPMLLAIFWYKQTQAPIFNDRVSDKINRKKFLIIWLILSILPFFFFKSFSRYLYGCMIPLSLLVSMLIIEQQKLQKYRIWLRLGGVLSLLVGALLITLVIWFRGWQLFLIVPILFMFAFVFYWWRANNLLQMSFISILFWVGIVGMVYPALGINRIPDGLVEKVKGEYVVLFAGPQPAMLPIVAGKGMRDTSHLWSLPAKQRDSCKGILIFSPVKHFITARMQLDKLNHSWTELGRYRVLSSRGSWIRIAREDATKEDWKRAFFKRDLDSLATEIILVRSTARQCLPE